MTEESGIVGADGQPLAGVEEEKKSCGDPDCGHDHGEEQEYEVTFFNYITSLGFQAMIFLGEIPNPMTNQTDKNLKQAKFLIDTLGLLEEKTKGNLDEQEQKILTASLYELRVKYVEQTKAEEKAA